MRPTLIIGCNRDAQRLAMSLQIERTSGLSLIGCLTADAGGLQADAELIPGVPISGHIDELPEIIERLGADAVIIVSSAINQSTVSTIVSQLRRMPIDVHISSGLFDVLPARVLVRDVAGTPFMLVRSTSLATHKLHMKRAFDLTFSTMVLLVGMPVWLAIAAAIKLDSPGPVFYRQERVGRGGACIQDVQVPFDVRGCRSAHRRSPRAQRGRRPALQDAQRPAHDPRRRLPAALLARRVPAVPERARGRHEHRGPSPAPARRDGGTTPTASHSGSTSCRASPACGRYRAARISPSTRWSGSTSSTSRTGRCDTTSPSSCERSPVSSSATGRTSDSRQHPARKEGGPSRLGRPSFRQ